MKKLKAFNMVEIMIVVCLLVTTVILCLPVIFNNSKEARIIASWKRLYLEAQTNFEVFNISDAELINSVCRSNVENKESEIFKIISPYLNADLSKSPKSLKSYHYKFKNGARIPAQSNIYTKLFAYQENGNVVAFKWLNCNCTETKPCASVLFDMNGVKAPNRIGRDIFGLYLYRNRIAAFGEEEPDGDKLEKDCNGHTSGMSCSEYYLRGGKF